MPSGSDGPIAASRVPAFTVETLAGEKLRFPDDFRGQLVLLDFWATWCGPCRAEKPYLTAAHERFDGKGLRIVGLSLDASSDKLKKFTTENKLVWTQAHGGAADLAGKLGITGIPAAFLVRADTSQILAEGDELRGAELVRTLEKHLSSVSQTPAGAGEPKSSAAPRTTGRRRRIERRS